MQVSTVFSVNGENYKVEGAGQETAKALRCKFPKFTKIVLLGFLINGRFKKRIL